MNNKIIYASMILFFIGVLLIYPFLIGIFSISSLVRNDNIIEFSYGSVLLLSMPLLSYFFIEGSIRSIYLWLIKKQRNNKNYKIIGILLTLWVVLSLPISWLGGYYLTSNNYQKCPPVNMFTQYYTIDLSLCSSPP